MITFQKKILNYFNLNLHRKILPMKKTIKKILSLSYNVLRYVMSVGSAKKKNITSPIKDTKLRDSIKGLISSALRQNQS